METKIRACRVWVLKLMIPVFLLIGLHQTPQQLHAANVSASDQLGRSVVQQRQIFNIGAVLDMGSWIGKDVIHSCIKMAVSDFYASHDHYKTRLVLRTMDSGGDSRTAISSALHLLNDIGAQALIVGPETALETKSLAVHGNKVNVPIFSFSSISSPGSGAYPYLIQISQDEILQFKGIASILNQYKWRTVAIFYEDEDAGKDSIPYLIASLQERSIRVTHRTPISPFLTDDQILDQLHELAVFQQTIFIVHMSPSLTSRMFAISKKLGMMKEGYAWIVTSKTMNQLQSMDAEVINSMQGVVGLKAHIPSTNKLRDLSLQWRNEFYRNNPDVESRELDVLGIWAYDTVRALAESIENVGRSENLTAKNSLSVGKKLLEEISRTRFTGLSGEFQISDGRLHSEVFEIVNVVGKVGRRVGFWTQQDGLIQEIRHDFAGKGSRSRSLYTTAQRGHELEAIIWPGVTTIAPGCLIGLTNGKTLRIAVPINEGFKQFASIDGYHQINKSTVKGFSVDVFQAAIDSLDYQVRFNLIPAHPEETGTYNDLVHQVYQQRYDGIVGDLTITANRTSYVDFTVPYTDMGNGIITKREMNDDIWLFSKPLSPELWLTITAFLVLTGFVVWFIEHSSSNQEFMSGSVIHQLGTMLWFGFSTLFYAHRERLSNNLSRLVVIVWLFVVLILTSTYTASLSSMLTLQKIRSASAEDSIGIQYNAVLGGSIVSNMGYKDARLRMYHSPEEFADALSKGSKEGGVGAITDEIPYLKIFLAKYGAAYAMVASEPVSGGFGFAFQKKYATLVSDLSAAIIKLREEGKLVIMEREWFQSKSPLIQPEAAAAATPNILKPGNFGGLFLISFCCSVLALFIRLNSILLNKLDYLNNIITVIRDKGLLLYLLNKITEGFQIQNN